MAELRSESIVLQKLQDIYRRKYFECAKEIQWIYAVPVYRKGKFYAALGASIPIGQHSAQAMVVSENSTKKMTNLACITGE